MIHFRALLGGTVTLLSVACGGTGGQPTPVSVPAPAAVLTPSPMPAPAPMPAPVMAAPFPKDYRLPYLSPTDGLFTVSAESPAIRTQAAIFPIASGLIYDGEWSNEVVRNYRPHTLVFLDGSEWKTLALRTDEPATIRATGFREPRRVCINFIFAAENYADPGASLIAYDVAGPDDQCGTEDDFVTALELATGRFIDLGRFLSGFSTRSFRDERGAITGYLAQVGLELRLYTPGAAGFKLVAGDQLGEVRDVARNARTRSSQWLRLANSIHRIDADGSLSPPLYTVADGERLQFGAVDANALYFGRRRDRDTQTEMLRVPFSGTPTVIGVAEGTAVIGAATKDSLLIRSLIVTASNNPNRFRYSVLAKAGGTPIDIGLTALGQDSLFGAAVTSDQRFLLNLQDRSSAGTQIRALTISSQGQVIESRASSEWISGDAADPDFSRPGFGTSNLVARVDQIPGPYATNGHQGATLAVRNFATAGTTMGPQLSGRGILGSGANSTPVLLARLIDPMSFDEDLFVLDLVTPNLTRLTMTPDQRETFPQ